jgi:hypothetical protein
MLDTDVHPDDRAELVARHGVIVATATAHAALAGAAVAGQRLAAPLLRLVSMPRWLEDCWRGACR